MGCVSLTLGKLVRPSRPPPPPLNSFQTGRMLKLEGLQGPLLSGMCERTLGGNSETGYWALERTRAMWYATSATAEHLWDLVWKEKIPLLSSLRAVISLNTRCPPPLPFLPQPIYPSLPPHSQPPALVQHFIRSAQWRPTPESAWAVPEVFPCKSLSKSNLWGRNSPCQHGAVKTTLYSEQLPCGSALPVPN